MNFNASEEQRLLAASIERFIARDYGFDARRRIVASSDGYSRAIWKTLAELGWLGLAVPAELGLPASFAVQDLLSDETYAWRTGGNFVRLAPGQAHVLHVR